MEYKIKIKNKLDRSNQSESTKYYVKKKLLFMWFYITHYDSCDRTFFPIMGFLVCCLITILIGLIIASITPINFKIVCIIHSIVYVYFLYLFNYYGRKDFYNISSASDYIKKMINFSKKVKSDDKEILFKYVDGKIEIKQ